MRSLLTKVAVAAALAVALPSLASASSARVEALGLQSDYIHDYVNVMYYPQAIARYPNLVYGDLGVKDVSGGDVADFTDNNANPALINAGRSMGAFVTAKWLPGVWGVQLNENYSPVSSAYGADYYNRNTNESFTLLWGQKFSGMTLGAQVNRSQSSIETATTTDKPYDWSAAGLSTFGNNARQIMNSVNASLGAEPRNAWGLGGGVSFDWDGFGRSHSADFSVQYRSLSLEQSTPTTTLEDNGDNAIAINGRAQIATADNTYLIPVFNWYSMQLGTQLTDTATPANNFKYDNTVSAVQFGIANGWVLRDSDMLVLGVSFQHQKADYADPNVAGFPFEISYNQMPALFGAFEGRPTNWLAVRMGASKPMFSKLEVTNVGAGTTVERKDSPIQYAVGLGFRVGGRLDIDTVMNQDFPFTGGWFASGQSEGPVSRISATYRW